jgi:hypothetical protein
MAANKAVKPTALNAERLSCARFVPNCLRLLLHAAAYRLLHALRVAAGQIHPALGLLQFDTRWPTAVPIGSDSPGPPGEWVRRALEARDAGTRWAAKAVTFAGPVLQKTAYDRTERAQPVTPLLPR